MLESSTVEVVAKGEYPNGLENVFEDANEKVLEDFSNDTFTVLVPDMNTVMVTGFGIDYSLGDLIHVLEDVEDAYDVELEMKQVVKLGVDCDGSLSEDKFRNMAENGDGACFEVENGMKVEYKNIIVEWYSTGDVYVEFMHPAIPQDVDECVENLLQFVDEEILVE